MNKITIIGMGYVGLANAILFASKNKITILEINKAKVAKLNSGISPIYDDLIQELLNKKNLHISATSSKKEAILGASTIVIALPTDFIKKSNNFDTSLIEEFVKYLDCKKF